MIDPELDAFCLVPGWKLSGDQEQRSKRYECLAEVIQVGLKPNKKCPSKRWCCQHVLHLGGLCQRRCCDHAASDFREGRGALRTFGMQTIDSIDHAKWQNPQNSFCLQDLFFAHVQVSKQTIKGNVQIEASAFENGKKGYGFDTPGPLDISSTNRVIISL